MTPKIVRPIEKRRKEYKIVSKSRIETIDVVGLAALTGLIAILLYVKIRKR